MAETAEQRAERRKKDWVFEGINHRVTPEVYQLITTPYRGQSNLGKKQTQVLSKIFTEECVLKDPVLPGVQISSNLLYTRIVCKFDTSYKKVLKNGQINVSKMLDGLLKNQHIPVELRMELAEGSSAKCCKQFLEEQARKRRTSDAASSGALQQAEQEVEAERNPAAAKEQERQACLTGRLGFVDRMTAPEANCLMFYLSCFFFACRIPFSVIDNYFFRRFIGAVRPSFSSHLLHRSALQTSQLEKVYEETVENTEALLDSTPGKRTLGLDGKTDIRGRATINLGNMKQGVVAYIGTHYLGKKKHSGETHAGVVQQTIGGNKQKYIAVTADNTGNMLTMFRLLRTVYPFLWPIHPR